MKTPIRVAVTGAAGNISYSLIWSIAQGACFGPDQPVILQLLEITPAMPKLEGVVMEIDDSAFPLVHGVQATDDAKAAFDGANAVFLVGSRPRTADMDRADLIRANGPIFVGQGQALNRAASDVRILTVGNPCNTNALIAAKNSDVPDERFTAMTRLDENRAIGLLARRQGVTPSEVHDVVVWGNHGPTMYPDVTWAKIRGQKVTELFPQDWLRGDFIEVVADRGRAVIKARGASSAASAANAAIDHMRDWFLGSQGRMRSMAVVSKGQYGVPEGLVFSMPCRCENGEYEVFEGLAIDDFGRQMLQKNIDALLEERAAVADLVKG